MPIVLDHMTIPVRDRDQALAFFEQVLGGKRGAVRGRIAGLWVSPILELQFRTSETFEPMHYAFRLDPDEFEIALGRIRSLGLPYGAARDNPNGEFMIMDGSKSAFFSDPNDHSLEIMALI